MSNLDKQIVTLKELVLISIAQTDALAQLLMKKGLITNEEYLEKLSQERAMYRKLLNSMLH
jgi:hypothetical protein